MSISERLLFQGFTGFRLNLVVFTLCRIKQVKKSSLTLRAEYHTLLMWASKEHSDNNQSMNRTP